MKTDAIESEHGSFVRNRSFDPDPGLVDFGPPAPDQIDTWVNQHGQGAKKIGESIHGGPGDEVDHISFLKDAVSGIETISHVHYKDGREEKKIVTKNGTFVFKLEKTDESIEYGGCRYDKFTWGAYDENGVRHSDKERPPVYRRPTCKYDRNRCLIMADLEMSPGSDKPLGVKYIGNGVSVA